MESRALREGYQDRVVLHQERGEGRTHEKDLITLSRTTKGPQGGCSDPLDVALRVRPPKVRQGVYRAGGTLAGEGGGHTQVKGGWRVVCGGTWLPAFKGGGILPVPTAQGAPRLSEGLRSPRWVDSRVALAKGAACRLPRGSRWRGQ